jgi:yersiniabactin nonribosomal peptide synthetase
VIVAQAPETVCRFQPAKLIDAMRRKLPDYMVPASYVPLAELPLSANGKVDRKALAALGPTAERPQGQHYAAPATELQAKIADVWEEVLGGIQAGIHESFFELGGDSLRAIQCINLLRERHRIELSMLQLYEASTISRLAQWIEAEAMSSSDQGTEAEEYEEGIV